jgi:hypothetical protein
MAHPTWTCVTGEVDDLTADDQWYWDPGDDREYTSRYVCGFCGWKFREDSYWGSSYGDTCPNCRTMANEGDDYGDEGCFSPRD